MSKLFMAMVIGNGNVNVKKGKIVQIVFLRLFSTLWWCSSVEEHLDRGSDEEKK